MIYGEKIRKLREEREWSQRELAKRVHINISVLNRIEKGTRKMVDEEIVTFANVFNTSADTILGISNSKNNISKLENDFSVNEEEKKKLEEYLAFLRHKNE